MPVAVGLPSVLRSALKCTHIHYWNPIRITILGSRNPFDVCGRRARIGTSINGGRTKLKSVVSVEDIYELGGPQKYHRWLVRVGRG